MIVCHHNDNDGRCAAYWVARHFKGKEPVQFLEMNYDKKFSVEDVPEFETVWIVDFSLEPEVMTELLKKTKDVVWVDHHETAVDKYKDFPTVIEGVRAIGLSGALLAWIYTVRPDVLENEKTMEDFLRDAYIKVPYPTRVVNDFDVFDMEMEDSVPFNYGSSAYDTSPGSGFWEKMHAVDEWAQWPEFNKVVEEGKLIKKYADQQYASLIKSYSYEATWDGVVVLVVNQAGKGGSLVFGDKFEEYPACITVGWNGTFWNVGLYSKDSSDFDCGKKATEQLYKGKPGGGHFHSAGFYCEKLPFEKDDTVGHGE